MTHTVTVDNARLLRRLDKAVKNGNDTRAERVRMQLVTRFAAMTNEVARNAAIAAVATFAQAA